MGGTGSKRVAVKWAMRWVREKKEGKSDSEMSSEMSEEGKNKNLGWVNLIVQTNCLLYCLLNSLAFLHFTLSSTLFHNFTALDIKDCWP